MKRMIQMIAVLMCLLIWNSVPVFAAGWTTGQGENSSAWWYDLGNGQYYAGTEQAPIWQWIDGNQDGIAECYAFDSSGWMYSGTETPDGWQVNENGAWVENGQVQTRNVEPGYEGTGIRLLSAGDSRVLVAYFSRTGTTRQAANRIHDQMGGTLFEIVPEIPYPSSYSQTVDRAHREIANGTLPALAADVEDFDSYEIIFVGYPIWSDTTPPVVNTFLNAHDFTGKTVIPFCTSGGSGIRGSMQKIRQYCAEGTILAGADLSGESETSIQNWLEELNLR